MTPDDPGSVSVEYWDEVVEDSLDTLLSVNAKTSGPPCGCWVINADEVVDRRLGALGEVDEAVEVAGCPVEPDDRVVELLAGCERTTRRSVKRRTGSGSPPQAFW